MSKLNSHILITGGSGLLALNWAITMRELATVTLGQHNRKVNVDSVSSIPINLDSVDFLCKNLEIIQPEIVIHTAGLTSVEGCEKNPNLAKEINVRLAANIAEATKRLEIKLVHISTDHLFNGKNSNIEEDMPLSPLNVYGHTKAQAENEVLFLNPNALVIRTNFYGWGPSYRQSFSDMIISNLRKGNSISLFNDIFYTSIVAEKLVTTTHDLVNLNANGIFHVVGDERISKFEFGLKIAKEFGLDESLILPKSIKSNVNLVTRPLDMSLSNKKLCGYLGKQMGSTDDHIQILKFQEKSNQINEIREL